MALRDAPRKPGIELLYRSAFNDRIPLRFRHEHQSLVKLPGASRYRASHRKCIGNDSCERVEPVTETLKAPSVSPVTLWLIWNVTPWKAPGNEQVLTLKGGPAPISWLPLVHWRTIFVMVGGVVSGVGGAGVTS